MKKKKLFTAIAIASIVLMAGCKEDDFVEVNGVCPLVVSTIPANLATEVPLTQIISATFNEEMNAATINQTTFTVKEGTTVIEGAVTYSGTTATFTPSAKLKANTNYEGRISQKAKDLKGNALQTDYVWAFSTGAIVFPIITITDPANLATGVALNKIVGVTFSIEMDPLTINASTFTLKQGTNAVAGAVLASGTSATFTPTLMLTPNTVYTARVTTGVKNLLGDAIVKDSVWTFTTVAPVIPLVILTDPLDQATNVSVSKTVTATFNMVMDPLTLSNTTFTLKAGATPVAGTISYSNKKAYFNPGSDLLENTVYTATITNQVKSEAGVNMVNNYVWSFTTHGTLTTPFVDLGSAGNYGILAGVGITSTGMSEIHNMDVGIYPGTAVSGFPPAVFIGSGQIFRSTDPSPVPANLLQAKDDLTAAYLFAAGATAPAPVTVAGNIGGQTLAPGIYKSTSTLLVEGSDLTLDAQGNPNAFWIFQVASAFTTKTGGNIVLAGGAQAKNVFWQTGSSATIGTYTEFNGNILALQSITMDPYATATGRMLARNGSVVLTSTNIITKP